MILFSGLILIINDRIPNKFIALGISILAVFTLAGPVAGKILPYPLLRIFSDFKGTYSDFNGYCVYQTAFAKRLLFGAGVIAVLWMLNQLTRIKKLPVIQTVFVSILLFSGIWAGASFIKGYIPKDEDQAIISTAQYEKQFKKYQNLPQPDITDITTDIKLYPSENAYHITGKYILKNQSDQPVSKILINFNKDLNIESAVFQSESQSIKIHENTAEILLQQPMQPDSTASLNFSLSYQWYAVNGHQSFNAIIENGSFMRISRYYPSVGYQKDDEIQDEHTRSTFNLGKPTKLKTPEAPEVIKKDFINLKMTVSTEMNQTVAGTGDLVKNGQKRDEIIFSSRQIIFLSVLRFLQQNIR